jgi:hypothetical protein
MKLLNLEILFTLPMLLLSQEPVPAGDEAHFNAAGAVADSPSADANPPTLPTDTTTAPTPLTPMQKVVRRMRRMVEPDDLLFSAAGAGIDQWRNIPPAWGQGAVGYADRFASAEGYVAAHNAVATGFDIGLHLDPRYRRMPGAPFKARLWNAVSQTFVANKDSGGKMINVSELAGNFSAGFIANAWEPNGYNSPLNGLERGALGLGYHTVKNLLREFLPNLGLHKVTDTTGTGLSNTVAEQR